LNLVDIASSMGGNHLPIHSDICPGCGRIAAEWPARYRS